MDKTFSQRLTELSNEAFSATRDALRKLGGSHMLPEGIHIVVDTCSDSGFLWHFEARKAVLKDDRIVLLAEIDPEREEQILDGDGDRCEPDECWWEGGEWYAEWEGLLEAFDAVCEAAETQDNG